MMEFFLGSLFGSIVGSIVTLFLCGRKMDKLMKNNRPDDWTYKPGVKIPKELAERIKRNG